MLQGREALGHPAHWAVVASPDRLLSIRRDSLLTIMKRGSNGNQNRRAVDFAFSKGNLRLIDGDELVGLIFEYYEDLDPGYQGNIPLRRVYVPEALSEQ